LIPIENGKRLSKLIPHATRPTGRVGHLVAHQAGDALLEALSPALPQSRWVIDGVSGRVIGRWHGQQQHAAYSEKPAHKRHDDRSGLREYW
jgi:hypothetical protein